MVPIPDTLRCLTIEEYTKDTNKPSSSKVTSYTCQVVDKTVASLVSKPEQVLLSVEYAALTYADALVVLGRSGAAREYPIIPGADFVGVVLKDDSEQFDVGDRVIAHGGELGRAIDGGFATLCYAPLSTLTRLPTNLTNKRAAMMGSAAITAMCSIIEIEKFNRTIKGKREVLITGATGSVGGFCLAILSHLGYTCTALTRDAETHRTYLSRMGAHRTLSVEEFKKGASDDSLAEQKYIAVIDVLGNSFVSTMLSQLHRGGIVVSCGCLAGDIASVSLLPFIRRGVRLVGVDSRFLRPALKEQVIQRLSGAQDYLFDANVDGSTATNERSEGSLFTIISMDQVQANATKKLNGATAGLSTTIDMRM